MTDKHKPREAMPVDEHIGARIRIARKAANMSQEALGDALGVTFQQVQKYERGTNRVGGSRLWELSKALNKTPNYFFEGLDSNADHSKSDMPELILLYLKTTDGIEFVKAIINVPKIQRKALLELIRTMDNSSDKIGEVNTETYGT